jgi:arabinose-5-phosphate isomerase
MPNIAKSIHRLSNDQETLRNDKLVKQAQRVFLEQSGAIASLAKKVNGEYTRAVELLLSTRGHVVFSGMGKSGLIGKKMAATFASTGTPSFFLHPAEAFHGDLGMITPHDTIVLVSNSGNTDEVIRLIPFFKQIGVGIIGFVGQIDSIIAQQADVVIDVSVEREVCPNNLAPTSSALATLAMGDALAVSLIRERNFLPCDFAQFHPGGNLGRKLLTKVKDVMRRRELPEVSPTQSVQEALLVMTQGRLGLVLVHMSSMACLDITSREV